MGGNNKIMLCEKCKKRDASVHMIKVINGNKTEVSLCEVCAKELTQMPFNIAEIASLENFNNDVKLDNILGGFFDALNKGKKAQDQDNKEEYDVVCKKCGSRLSKFKTGRKVGCPECYESFGADIEKALSLINNTGKYVGKVPLNVQREIQNKKEIEKLKDKLQIAIQEENYEDAIELRDKINYLRIVCEEGENAKVDL